VQHVRDSGSRALQHDDDGHGCGPTSISKMIWILIQDITYLAIGYLCSANENTGIFSDLLATVLWFHGVVVGWWYVVVCGGWGRGLVMVNGDGECGGYAKGGDNDNGSFGDRGGGGVVCGGMR
jgi:hypothetical protein